MAIEPVPLHNDTVEVLREALRRAENGDLRVVAVFGVVQGGDSYVAYGHTERPDAAIGGLMRVVHMICAENSFSTDED